MTLICALNAYSTTLAAAGLIIPDSQASLPAVEIEESSSFSAVPEPSATLTRLQGEPSPPSHAPTTGNRLAARLAALPVFMIGALLCLLSGCSLDRSVIPRADTGPGDGGPDTGIPPIDGGDDGGEDSGMDAGDAGPGLSAPTHLRPAEGQVLAPTRPFMSAEVPIAERATVQSYQFCVTNAALTGLDDAAERAALAADPSCPDTLLTQTTDRAVIDPLQATQAYYRKARACANPDGTNCGPWNTVWRFDTDNAVIGWWRLDDAAGATAVDSSPAGNNGSLTNFDVGTAWDPGFVGGALLLDGADDYVAFGDIHNLDSSNQFSLEAWANRSALGSFATILGRQDLADSAIARGYWFSFSDDNRVWFQMINETGIGNQLDVLTTAQFDALGTPQNILVTYNGSSAASGVSIYVDGIDQPTSVMSDSLTGTTLNSGPFRIGSTMAEGGSLTSTELNFPGLIDDVIMYNRVLTPIEALNNFCAREALHREETGDPSPLPTACQGP